MQLVQLLDRTPFAYEKIAVTTIAVARLDETNREAASAIFLTVETNDIRYKIEGGDPDINDGHLLSAAGFQNLYIVDKHAVRNLRMIAIGDTATIIVTYYK